MGYPGTSASSGSFASFEAAWRDRRARLGSATAEEIASRGVRVDAPHRTSATPDGTGPVPNVFLPPLRVSSCAVSARPELHREPEGASQMGCGAAVTCAVSGRQY